MCTILRKTAYKTTQIRTQDAEAFEILSQHTLNCIYITLKFSHGSRAVEKVCELWLKMLCTHIKRPQKTSRERDRTGAKFMSQMSLFGIGHTHTHTIVV